jgi:4-amino-4-deoxy-L-arabinose transferase-like glycosyltransferase
MQLSAPFSAIRRLPDRFRDALTDPARADSAVLWSLAAYVVVWTVYGTIAKAAQGLHPDMVEVVAWSRDLSLGYLKHPPLAAWLVAGWFAVFPVAAWSYYLLAMLMPALALWFAWKLSADYLDIEKRVVGLLLLTLVPFFNFHALKYNVNTVLMPLWAATTLCFLRSYRTHSIRWAALAGLCAAGAMLGKYWSIFLLAGLVLAALIDKRRVAYFKSPAPWVTVVVGAVVLAPHVVWLVQHNFAPFTYAMIVHGEKPFGATALSAVGYIGGSVGYVAVPLIVAAVMARAKPAVLADLSWPRETERRLAALAFWLPFLLPAVGAVAGKSEITSLWSMPAFTLLGVLLLSPEGVVVRAVDTKRLLIAAIAVPLVMLLASPVIAYVAQRNGPPASSAQASLLARQVEQAWRQMTPAPLRFVGGEADLAYGVVTYAADKPRALTDMPPPDAAELARAGAVYVCLAEDQSCRLRSAGLAVKVPGSRTVESSILRAFMRVPSKSQRYTLILVPPQR